MSPNPLRTMPSEHRAHPSGAHTHTGRRRHAAPSDSSWIRRAGLVGGVVSAFALCGAAAPAMAENPHHHRSTAGSGGGRPARHASATAGPAGDAAPVTLLTGDAGSKQAAAAIERTAGEIRQRAIDASLAAAEQRAAARALKAATARKAAAAKAAAAARAERERAASAAASRSARRTALGTSGSSPGSGGSGSAGSSPAGSPAGTTVAPASASKADRLIAFLKSQLGKPYVYGAAGPDSYDCSGLTQVAFGTVGVSLPRTSQEQSTAGTPVSVSALQPGDLIFWGGEGSAYHVGVYIGGGQYLDAANPSTPVAVHPLADYMPDWAVRVL